MTRILFVGQKPETVDFSEPSLPPGFNAEKINAGIALGVSKIEDRGWQGDTCMITPDPAGSAKLESALKGVAYDCVVIGGGLRLPPKSLALFETVVNIIHKAAVLATELIRGQRQWSRGSPVVVVKPSEDGLSDDGLCDVDSGRRVPRDPLANSLMGACLVEVRLVLGHKPTKMLVIKDDHMVECVFRTK